MPLLAVCGLRLAPRFPGAPHFPKGRFACGVAQRDTANSFVTREWIVNRQLRVEAITPAPKPAHGLLASVDHFCECRSMRLSICRFASSPSVLLLAAFGIHNH